MAPKPGAFVAVRRVDDRWQWDARFGRGAAAAAGSGDGLDPLREHVRGFLAGTGPRPWFRAPQHGGAAPALDFTCTRELWDAMREIDPRSFAWRSTIDALRFGLRGCSRGGRNGIFRQRPVDARMTERTRGLAARGEAEVADLLGCAPADVGRLSALKIVCHNPRGERVVGLASADSRRAVLLGLARY